MINTTTQIVNSMKTLLDFNDPTITFKNDTVSNKLFFKNN